MTRTRTQQFAFLLSALSLAGTMLVGVAHHHCGEGCAHQPSDGSCHHEERQCCGGVHPHPKPPPSRSPAPMHDEDQCLVCRYLAERPLPVALVELPLISEAVEVLDSALAATDIASPPKSHHARAPPV